MNNISHSNPEPELLRQLRERSLTLQQKVDKLAKGVKLKQKQQQSLNKQLQKVEQEIQIHYRKNKSLIVLLNDLQLTYHNNYLLRKQEQQIDQQLCSSQNSLLRFILIQQSENVKQSQKLKYFLNSILLDKNKGRAKQFIKKSNFIESQSEIIAKLNSQINLFRNNNLQCKRKWFKLQQETQGLDSQNRLLSIQNQRQKVDIKQLYQQYLMKIDQAKQKMVTFNQTQKQSTINEYLVKQIAVIQQSRVDIQKEYQNLKYHAQSLEQEFQRISNEHQELKNFFNQQDREGALAYKMKKRIEQLRDVLIQSKKKNKNMRGSKLRKVLEKTKSMYKVLREGNDYIQIQTKQQNNRGSFLDEESLSNFFNSVLQEKDKQLAFLVQQQMSLKENLKQLQNNQQLISSQIQNLKENLDLNDYKIGISEKNMWSNVTESYKNNLN